MFDTKPTRIIKNGIVIYYDEEGNILESDDTVELETLKNIIDLTYKDGINSKEKIRNMANKRLDKIC